MGTLQLEDRTLRDMFETFDSVLAMLPFYGKKYRNSLLQFDYRKLILGYLQNGEEKRTVPDVG